jgi:hypothetical protein
MQTPAMNNTSKPINEGKTGSADTTPRLQLDPWDIADLLICKRDEQPICIEDATDAEFEAWVQSNAIPVKDNGIVGWSFDDRCRLVNHVLAQGGRLAFVDGTHLPDHTNAEQEESCPTPSTP